MTSKRAHFEREKEELKKEKKKIVVKHYQSYFSGLYIWLNPQLT